MSVAFRRDSDEEHLEPQFELPPLGWAPGRSETKPGMFWFSLPNP